MLVSSFYAAFADSEKVCVNPGSGLICSPTTLGSIDPCSDQPFVVDFVIPQLYTSVAKFEWYVNGVLVKTTTNPSDPTLIWNVKAKTTTVYCDVTYKKADGTLSSTYTATSFTPNVKSLNITAIEAISGVAYYGCTSPVSYQVNTYTCTGGGVCSYVYNVSSYTVTWQAPSGWTQSSISSNGSSVSFIPNATTGGTLTATITLPCGYIDTRTFAITRDVKKPEFTSSNPTTICTSPGSIDINAVCGATDYTYTITGPSGVVFTSNSLQTLTTSSTNPSVSFSGSGQFTVNAKANYAGGISSAETAKQFYFGVPADYTFTYLYNTVNIDGYPYVWANTVNIPNALYYNWYYKKHTGIGPGGGTGGTFTYIATATNYFEFTLPECDKNYTIKVEAVTACGTVVTPLQEGLLFADCGGSFAMSLAPNPTSSTLNITFPDKKQKIVQYEIQDKTGFILQKGNGSNDYQQQINVGQLRPDYYFIRVFNGTKWISKRFIKQ
jgi:hypothetical protein